MRKLLLLLMSCILSLSLNASTWLSSGQYDISWYSSSKNEFTISTAKQFAGIAYLVNNGYTTFSGKTINLSSDISLSSNDWVTVGNAEGNACFQGKLNGNGHTISGVYIDLSVGTYPNYGLFAQLKNAEISEITLKGNINCDFGDERYLVETKAGMFAGYAYGTTFTNCHCIADVTYDRMYTQGSSSYYIYLGGLVGHTQYCSFIRCTYTGDILMSHGMTGTSTANTMGGAAYLGGIVGKSNGGSFKFCGVMSGSFSAKLAASKEHKDITTYLGGIAGRNDGYTEFDACYSHVEKFLTQLPLTTYGGRGSTKFYVGGITGYASFRTTSGYIYNCYSSCDYLNAGGQAVEYGGIVGDADVTSAGEKYKANFSPSSFHGDYNSQYVVLNYGHDGATTFSKSEMKSKAFLDELNLYPTLNELDYIWEFATYNSYPSIGTKPAELTYNIISSTNYTAEVIAPNSGTYKGDIKIPSTVKIGNKTYTVTQIGEKAFYNCTEVTSIQLPNTITTIRNSAFYGCTSLTSFTMPTSVEEIYGAAFWKCPIGKVYISDLDKWCKIRFKESTGANPMCYYSADIYLNDKRLTDLTLPKNVKMPFAAFVGCKSINTVKFQEYDGYYSGRWFQSCRGLKKIYLSESVWVIPGYSFADCTALTDIYCERTTPPKLDSGWNNETFDVYFAFVGCNFDSIKLHVPKGCKEKYASALGWNNFSNIIEDYEEAGVDEIVVDDEHERVVGVYTLNGVKVSETTDNLPAGIYIVRRKSSIEKVIIR